MKDNRKNKIYPDFSYPIELYSKENQSPEKHQKNCNRSKSQDCNIKSIEKLIAFISNKNKFYINPNFDQEGSKKFLQSKYIAMEKIVLDDNIKDLEPKKKNYKEKFISGGNLKTYCKKEKFFSQKNANILKGTLVSSSKKNESHKRKSTKTNNRLTSKKGIVLRLTLNDSNISDELKVKKKHRKNKNNCNEFELKMFKDKNIKNLEPIEGVNNIKKPENTDKNEKNIKQKYSFVGKGSNSSLINIITQMK